MLPVVLSMRPFIILYGVDSRRVGKVAFVEASGMLLFTRNDIVCACQRLPRFLYRSLQGEFIFY